MKRRVLFISISILFVNNLLKDYVFAQNFESYSTTENVTKFDRMNSSYENKDNSTFSYTVTEDSKQQLQSNQSDNDIKLDNKVNLYLQPISTNDNNIIYKEVEVPENYPIPVVFAQDADSESLNNGERVLIRPASDIYINNKLIFSKNSTGYAVIKSVRPARNLGKYGYIIIKEGFLPDITGTLRAVNFSMKIRGERCQWAGIISHAMIWNPIGWIVGLKEGTPAVIKSGDTATCKNKAVFIL